MVLKWSYAINKKLKVRAGINKLDLGYDYTMLLLIIMRINLKLKSWKHKF